MLLISFNSAEFSSELSGESTEVSNNENKNPITDGIINLLPQENQPNGDHQVARAIDESRRKEAVKITSSRLKAL